MKNMTLAQRNRIAIADAQIQDSFTTVDTVAGLILIPTCLHIWCGIGLFVLGLLSLGCLLTVCFLIGYLKFDYRLRKEEQNER